MCSEVTGQCIPYEEDFEISLKAAPNAAEASNTTPTEQAPEAIDPQEDIANTDTSSVATEKSTRPKVDLNQISGAESSSLWSFMVLAFLAGLAALLTPCVFPMIPMTVTFFTGGSKNRGRSHF